MRVELDHVGAWQATRADLLAHDLVCVHARCLPGGPHLPYVSGRLWPFAAVRDPRRRLEKARMPIKPPHYGRMLVRRVIVEDHVEDLSRRNIRLRLVLKDFFGVISHTVCSGMSANTCVAS
jgi:hypothetical protein